jgi:hypothetical protein
MSYGAIDAFFASEGESVPTEADATKAWPEHFIESFAARALLD